jgi:paraquat-inducible protein B
MSDMMETDDLAYELDSIYKHIQETSINSDPEELKEELDQCSMYLARSSQLLADAEYFLNKAKGEAASKYAKSITAPAKFNATESKYFIEGVTTLETRLHTMAERLNRTLTHRIDAIRSVLSYEKMFKEKASN